MGIIQHIKDELFINKCIRSFIETIPQYTKYAGEFCLDNKDRLLDARKSGMGAKAALTDVFALILQNSTDGHAPRSDYIVYKIVESYGMSLVYRNPMAIDGQMFMAIFKHLGIKVEFNPYSHDSLARWQSLQQS